MDQRGIFKNRDKKEEIKINESKSWFFKKDLKNEKILGISPRRNEKGIK